jgi:AMMECR1 domain-containing protein
MPTRENIASELIQNAISAGVEDPRFEPVRKDELDELEYSVDVLGEAEKIDSKDELDVLKYGVNCIA